MLNRRAFLRNLGKLTLLASSGTLASCSILDKKKFQLHRDFSVPGFGVTENYPHVQMVTPTTANLRHFEKSPGRTINHYATLIDGLTPDSMNRVSLNGKIIQIRTPPLEGTLRVAHITDTHGAYVRKDVLEKVALENPHLIIHCGDVVNDGRNRTEWQAWARNSKCLAPFCLYPAIGNHSYNSKNWTDYFDRPGNEYTYSFSMGSLFFAFLDSNEFNSVKLEEQFSMLKPDITRNADKWKVLVMHYPLFANTTLYRKNEAEERRKIISPFIEENKFPLILTGHGHVYERSVLNIKNKPVHIMGSPVGRVARENEDCYYACKSRQGFGYGILTFNGSLFYEAKDESGNTFDEVEIKR